MANNIVNTCDKVTLEESQNSCSKGKNFFATKSRFSTHNVMKNKMMNRHIVSSGNDSTMDGSKINASITDTFNIDTSTMH
jgi:hypothetical protein